MLDVGQKQDGSTRQSSSDGTDEYGGFDFNWSVRRIAEVTAAGTAGKYELRCAWASHKGRFSYDVRKILGSLESLSHLKFGQK